MTGTRFATYISILALCVSLYQGCIARQALHYSQRAYVFARFEKSRTRAVIGQRLGALLPIVNSGHTPGKDMRIWIATDLFTGPSFPKGDGLHPGIFSQPTTVFPDSEVDEPIFLNSTLNKSMLDSLEAHGNAGPSARFYIWGRIEYATVFDNYAFTQFCFYIFHNSELPPETSWVIYPCEEGNHAN
jgi:hypothetical protein